MDIECHLEGGRQAVADLAKRSRQPLGGRERDAQLVGERPAQLLKTSEAKRLRGPHNRRVAGLRLRRQRRRRGDQDLLAVGLKEPRDALLGRAHPGEAVCNSLIEAWCRHNHWIAPLDSRCDRYHHPATRSCMLQYPSSRGCTMDPISWSVAAPAVG